MAIRLDQKQLAAMAMADLHFDASEGLTFARELLRVRARVFEVQYPELLAMSLIPKNTECDETDEQFTYRVYSEYGTTAVGAAYSSEAPRADVSAVEATPVIIKPMTSSYGYDFNEARIAAKTGNQLPQRKANAARKAIAQEMNRVLTFGDSTKYGTTLQGIANLIAAGATAYTVATGISGSKTWALKTSDEILADLNGIAAQIVTDTSNIEQPTDIVIPLSSYELIVNRRLGDGSDMTILKFFLMTNPHIKTVTPWYALESAPASEWTGRRMICYKKDPDVLECLVPIEFEQLAPQMKGYETVTMCHGRCGGVVLYKPKAVAYGDGI